MLTIEAEPSICRREIVCIKSFLLRSVISRFATDEVACRLFMLAA